MKRIRTFSKHSLHLGRAVCSIAMVLSLGLTQVAYAERVVVREGTVVAVTMDNSLSSATAHTGERFTSTVRTDRSNLGFPVGTKIEGVVSDVQRTDGRQPGSIDVDFRTVRTADGQTYNMQGSLISLDDKRIKRESDGRMTASSNNKSKDRLKFIAIGAGAGLLIGKLTKMNTLEGILLGAAGGYIYNETRKSKPSDVTVKAGTEFGIRMDRELVFNSNGNGRNYDTRNDNGTSDQPSYGSRNDIRVTLDGRAIHFDNSIKPVQDRDHVLVPLGPVMEEANISYRYDDRRRIVRVEGDDAEVYARIGQSYALVDGERENLETPVEVRDGEVYVPLRFLALATGMRVTWDSRPRTVVMTASSYAGRNK